MVVGLGNPGPQYRGTRHNVGFDVVDRLAAKHKIRVDRSRQKALVGVGEISGVGVALVKPLTFMNLSGQSVAPLARAWGIKPAAILVVADDLDMPVGRTRMKPKGSSGGHNGHKSLIAALGTEEYPRLKIGIGKSDDPTISHVLGRFHPDERVDIDRALDRCVAGAEAFIREGLDAAMNLVNGGQA